MKPERSRKWYVGQIVASLIFIGMMAWSSSIHLSQREVDEAIAQGDLDDAGRMVEQPRGEPVPPFLAGFATACMVGGYWWVILYHNPRLTNSSGAGSHRRKP